jgi:4-hydroxy-3-polyprenylbenzoate decarboxylase
MGSDEADYAGALLMEPVELVKCETNDLLVPANAEIIIEGEILPNMRLPEGPFIITMTPEGIGMGGKVAPSISGAAISRERLIRHGIPVVDVFFPPEMEGLGLIVSVERTESDIASKIAEALCSHGLAAPKVIVVDKDIDVFDIREVVHAFSTRCHPINGVKPIEARGGWPLCPFLSQEDREKLFTTGETGAVVFDCTWPIEWSKESEVPMRMSFNKSYPTEIKEMALKKWRGYGLK